MKYIIPLLLSCVTCGAQTTFSSLAKSDLLKPGDFITNVRSVPNNLLSNLTAYWRFEEADGANRLSETNSHTLVNFGTVTRESNHKEGSFASGMAGANYLTNYDAAFRMTNGWSMNGWVLFTNTPSQNDVVVSRWGPGTSWILSPNATNTLTFGVTDAGQVESYQVSSTVTLTASNYINWAIGIDGSDVWMQVNNEPRISTPYTTLFASSDPLAFGFNSVVPGGNDTETFFDATGFWSRSIDTNEVALLYNGGAGFFYNQFQGSNAPVIASCDLTNGIVGYWPMDEPITSGTRADSYGTNNLTDSNNGVQSIEGIINKAAETDVGAGLQHADNALLGFSVDESFTFDLWVYSGNGATLKCIVDKGDFGTTDEYIVYDTGSVFRFAVTDGAGGLITVDASDIGARQAFTLYHMTAGYNSTNQTIFICINNGNYNTAAQTTGTHRNASAFSVGAASAGSFAWNGWIDEVKFFRGRALSQSESRIIYTNELHGIQIPNSCAPGAGRNVVVFEGDSRITGTGSNTNLPAYFALQDWATTNDATIVNVGVAGSTLDDVTNRYVANVKSRIGGGTNLFLVTEVGINDRNSGWTNQSAYITEYTNYLGQAWRDGAKLVPISIYDQIGLTNESVRVAINNAISNFPPISAYLYTDPIIATNLSYWFDETHLNDDGNKVVATNLNATFNLLHH